MKVTNDDDDEEENRNDDDEARKGNRVKPYYVCVCVCVLFAAGSHQNLWLTPPWILGT